MDIMCQQLAVEEGSLLWGSLREVESARILEHILAIDDILEEGLDGNNLEEVSRWLQIVRAYFSQWTRLYEQLRSSDDPSSKFPRLKTCRVFSEPKSADFDPFSCTFHTCGQHFRREDTWIAHERIQHRQVCMWRCTYASCNSAFYHIEAARTHLLTYHRIDTSRMNLFLGTMVIDADFTSSFWCGFCVAILFVRSEGYEERFAHVAQHFRDGRTIFGWEHIVIDGERRHV